MSRDIPFTPTAADDQQQQQQVEGSWIEFSGSTGGLEDEGTVIMLAVTLAVVLVAITVVVVVFVCVRAAEQRRAGAADNITDIKYRHDTDNNDVEKSLPNGSAKTNGCLARNGAQSTSATSSPCVRGLYGGPPSTVVDCRYTHAPNTSLPPQVRHVQTYTSSALIFRATCCKSTSSQFYSKLHNLLNDGKSK